MKSNLKRIDTKRLQEILIRENKFLNDLFAIVPVPSHEQDEEEEGERVNISRQYWFDFYFVVAEDKTNGTIKPEIPKTQLKSRAKSISELQERLQAIQSKKKLTYKEKLVKKGLKNRMKKKTKQDERNAKQKLLRAEKQLNTKQEQDREEEKREERKDTNSKPIFNSEDKMVFSKFDFSDIGKKVKRKEEKDPKKLLQKLEEQKEKLAELEESGEKEKAIEIKEKLHWKSALAKAEGKKVKDNPVLLKKTIQKQKQRVKSSKKKWEARQEGVKKAQEERQRKRTENIEKRKKEKKMNKLKKAAKKGKIIPGF